MEHHAAAVFFHFCGHTSVSSVCSVSRGFIPFLVHVEADLTDVCRLYKVH